MGIVGVRMYLFRLGNSTGVSFPGRVCARRSLSCRKPRVPWLRSGVA